MKAKRLLWMKGQTVVKEFMLDKEHYTIGRSKENDLVFDHVKVSRHHARLYQSQGHYLIQDLNSTNYVFVNGVRVKQKKLEANDRLQISSEIDLVYSESEQAPPTVDKSRTMLDIHKHFIHKDDLSRLKKVTQSVVLLNSLDSILKQILKEGIALTNAERGLIVLTDSQGEVLWKFATTHQIDKEKAESGEADISHSILSEAIKQRSTVVRINQDQQTPAPSHSDSMMSLKIFSAMCAPLVLDERVIGVFYVDARQVMNNFTEVDQFLFNYLADHAAIAIFNSKRYADLQAENQRLKQSNELLKNECHILKSERQRLKTVHGQSFQEMLSEASAHRMNHSYSAGGVVLNLEGKILIVNQKNHSWSLPKGKIEVGEEPAITAHREILEESGILYLHLIESLGIYTRSALDAKGEEDLAEIKTIYMYLFTTEQMSLQPQDKDNPEARWVEPDEVLSTLTHPKDREFFSSVLSGIKVHIAAKQARQKHLANKKMGTETSH